MINRLRKKKFNKELLSDYIQLNILSSKYIFKTIAKKISLKKMIIKES